MYASKLGTIKLKLIGFLSSESRMNFLFLNPFSLSLAEDMVKCEVGGDGGMDEGMRDL